MSHWFKIEAMIFNRIGSVDCGSGISGLEIDSSHPPMGKNIMPVRKSIKDLHDVNMKLWNLVHHTYHALQKLGKWSRSTPHQNPWRDFG
jgi:hypothetical protein